MLESTRALDPKRVAALFEAAISIPATEREAFLDQRCGNDAELKQEVLALLAADDQMEATSRIAPARSDGLPESIGRFEITRRLGEGGMGVVFEGRDAELDRAVAIKLLRDPGDARDARARLLREAQALAKITHPNVIPVYEAGVHGRDLYIAMELVPGGTLGEWLRAEPRDWREIVRIFVEAGRGLAAAHEAGIVHRDFKPDNVLLGSDGRPRVADFGIARAEIGGAAPADASALAIALTRAGAVMGTPRYMSPEHYEGRGIGPASDQFSFSVALYRALFGKPPFDGDSLAELREAVLTRDPAEPSASGMPPRVVAAVMRGLARSPSERWPSMAAQLAELETVLSENPELSPATGRGIRFAAAGALLAIGVARLTYTIRSAQVFTPENLLRQGVAGLVMVLLIGALFGRKLLRTVHNRRVGLIFLLAVVMMFVRRLLALMSDGHVLQGLRDEAIGLAALFALGAVVVERWLAINALLMLAFAVAATLDPELSPVWMGATLNVSVAVAVVTWGSEERAARRASREASRAFSTPKP